jgi:hypothetical protein
MRENRLRYCEERCTLQSRWCRWSLWKLRLELSTRQRGWLAVRKLPIELSGLRKTLCSYGGVEYYGVLVKINLRHRCCILYRWDISSGKSKIPKLLPASWRQAWETTCEVFNPVRSSSWSPNLCIVTWSGLILNILGHETETYLVLNNLIAQKLLGSECIVRKISYERIILESICPLDVCVWIAKCQAASVSPIPSPFESRFLILGTLKAMNFTLRLRLRRYGKRQSLVIGCRGLDEMSSQQETLLTENWYHASWKTTSVGSTA